MRTSATRPSPSVLAVALVMTAVLATVGMAEAQLAIRSARHGTLLTGGGTAPFGVSYTAPGLADGLATFSEASVPMPAGTLKNLRVYLKGISPNRRINQAARR